MPRCRISFLSELRLARTGLQNMLLCWLHSILFKRRYYSVYLIDHFALSKDCPGYRTANPANFTHRKLTFDALSQYQEFPPGSNSGTLVVSAIIGS
jgi:hypothetical protein